MNRLFVPLSTDPFLWFASGKKSWEVRKYGRQYTEKHVYKNRVVELRKGYTDKKDAIWGIITEVIIESDLNILLDIVPYQELIPTAVSKAGAISTIESILSIESEYATGFIAFKIEPIEKINLIDVANVYLPLIINGEKTTTIRKGTRNYSVGPGIMRTELEVIPIQVKKVIFSKLSQLTQDDANKDGFDNLKQLIDSLLVFYPDLKMDDKVTIVYYDNMMGDK